MKDKELYFENVVDVGDLYIEHVFLEFEKEPIFFTCVDVHERLFVCLCSEIRMEQRWIISECSLQTLSSVVNGEVDLSDGLCKSANMRMVIRNIEGEEFSYVITPQTVDVLDLPKEGTLLRCNTTGATNYLVKKSLEELVPFLNSYIDKTIECEDMYIKYNMVFNVISQMISKEIKGCTGIIQATYNETILSGTENPYTNALNTGQNSESEDDDWLCAA